MPDPNEKDALSDADLMKECLAIAAECAPGGDAVSRAIVAAAIYQQRATRISVELLMKDLLVTVQSQVAEMFQQYEERFNRSPK